MLVSASVKKKSRQSIDKLLSNTGEELPILRQSCRGIIDSTDNESSNFNDVSEVIMRDQALIAKTIKLANSAIYHNPTPVTTALHAVKIIGFDLIRALAIGAEFIEAADKCGGNAEVLKRLLARAFLSATAAREMEEATKFPKNPNLFTSTMLYTLGDLVLAYYLPDIYQTIEATQRNEPDRMNAVECEFLGQTLKGLGAKIAKEWGLPESITNLMEARVNLSDHSWNTQQEKFVGLVCCANELGKCLLSPPTPSAQNNLQQLLAQLPQTLNVPPKTLKTITVTAFKKASQLSRAANIDPHYFAPNDEWEKLPLPKHMKEFIGDIYTVTTDEKGMKKFPKTAQNEEPAAATEDPSSTSNAQTDFKWLQDFSLKALSTSDPNQILQWAAKGLHSASQFERVVLTILSPESDFLEPRVGYGDKVMESLPLFRCSIKAKNLFAISCKGCEPVQVENLREELNAGRISQEFLQEWGEDACLLGPVFAKTKPVGLIIADKGISKQPITQSDYAFFVMVLAQLNTNLTRLAYL